MLYLTPSPHDMIEYDKCSLYCTCIRYANDNFRSTILLACFCSLLYMFKCESTLSDVILYCHCIYPHGLNSLLEVRIKYVLFCSVLKNKLINTSLDFRQVIMHHNSTKMALNLRQRQPTDYKTLNSGTQR